MYGQYLSLMLYIHIPLFSALHYRQSEIHYSPFGHQLYNLQEAKSVQKSQSIRLLNQCKQECLNMKQYFPFTFKYHRLIRRQKIGYMKFITGECLFAFNKSSSQWNSWAKMRIFIEQSNINSTDPKELERFNAFNIKCEDQTLNIPTTALVAMDFGRIHSDFEYYDDGSFKNLQPFNDLNSLLQKVASYQ